MQRERTSKRLEYFIVVRNLLWALAMMDALSVDEYEVVLKGLAVSLDDVLEP